MAQHTRDTQTDIRAAVDAISSHFSTDTTTTPTTGRGAHVPRTSPSATADDTEPPDDNRLDAYLHFSDTHRGSNHILLGVLTFFILVSGVWGFLWYQSLVRSNISNSFQFDVLTDSTDDLSTIFDELISTTDATSAIDQEITLKTDLANALRKEYNGAAVLGTTTTSTTTTPITE